MNTRDDHWKAVFLDAYKTHTGDARRLALNEAWFAYASSDDYYRLGVGDSLHAYWTALVDAAHVEQEQTSQPFDEAIHGERKGTMEQLMRTTMKNMELTGYVGRIEPLTEPDHGHVFPSGYDFPFPRPDQAEPPIAADPKPQVATGDNGQPRPLILRGARGKVVVVGGAGGGAETTPLTLTEWMALNREDPDKALAYLNAPEVRRNLLTASAQLGKHGAMAAHLIRALSGEPNPAKLPEDEAD